jgi:fermentation-respiration switch protein FrsA (DUF1100 family)
MLTRTLVDDSRTTPANGSAPQIGHRTLVTTVLYPATGTPSSEPRTGASPDKKGGPYPLIAFSHGTASTPQTYLTLLTYWASKGYVVVAPKFPLSSLGAAGGVNVGNVVDQPQDVSFAISSVLRESAESSGPLAGLINADEIGAAGHSLGGITTIGLVANTCCKDRRIKAAAVLAGSLEGYPKGHYDVAQAPPLLVVSGTDDALVPYPSSVEIFNKARGPKALLTINGGSHGDAGGFVAASRPAVLRATTDFFDAYLRADAAARTRLAHDGGGVTKMFYVPKPGATATVALPSEAPLHLQAKATPDSNLHGGQTVTVTWSGYTPGKAITILQCTPANRQLTNSAACDFTHAQLLKPNPTGQGSLPLQIVEGKVGTGICDASHPGCFILVDNASSSDPSKNVFLPISFAK